jgi:hypothetical protein
MEEFVQILVEKTGFTRWAGFDGKTPLPNYQHIYQARRYYDSR